MSNDANIYRPLPPDRPADGVAFGQASRKEPGGCMKLFLWIFLAGCAYMVLAGCNSLMSSGNDCDASNLGSGGCPTWEQFRDYEED